MNLEWTEELSVGHPLIDTQHRELFEQFGRFLAACDRRQGPEHLCTLFGYLDVYVARHFREEEELMRTWEYPEIDRHRREHRNFIEKLQNLKKAWSSTGPTVEVLIRTNKTLLYWLTEHIHDVDMQLGSFLRRAGAMG